MIIYVVLDIYHVSLYAMQFNLNNFDVILCILMYVIICVTEIQIMNDFKYNFRFNI